MLLGAVDIMIENELKDGYGFRSENLYVKRSKKGSMVSISVYPFAHMSTYIFVLCLIQHQDAESILLSCQEYIFFFLLFIAKHQLTCWSDFII